MAKKATSPWPATVAVVVEPVVEPAAVAAAANRYSYPWGDRTRRDGMAVKTS